MAGKRKPESQDPEEDDQEDQEEPEDEGADAEEEAGPSLHFFKHV